MYIRRVFINTILSSNPTENEFPITEMLFGGVHMHISPLLVRMFFHVHGVRPERLLRFTATESSAELVMRVQLTSICEKSDVVLSRRLNHGAGERRCDGIGTRC